MIASLLGGVWRGSASSRRSRSAVYAGGCLSRPRPAEPVPAPPRTGPRTSGASSSSRTRPSAARRCSRRSASARRGSRATCSSSRPALNSPLKHWVSDEDGAAPRAQERLERASPAPRRRRRRGAARSATPTRSRRSRTRCAPSAPTRSSSRPIPRAARTGSSGAWSRRRASASRVPITHVVVDLERERRTRGAAGPTGDAPDASASSRARRRGASCRLSAARLIALTKLGVRATLVRTRAPAPVCEARSMRC